MDGMAQFQVVEAPVPTCLIMTLALLDAISLVFQPVVKKRVQASLSLVAEFGFIEKSVLPTSSS